MTVSFYKINRDRTLSRVETRKEHVEWRDSEEGWQRCKVQLTFVGKFFVSTVFIGIDYKGLSDEGKSPELFETMVFGGPLGGYKRASVSYVEAVGAHEETVEKVKLRGEFR